MKDYSKMSDAEIAMRVACSIDGVEVDDDGIPKFAVDCYLYNSANSIKWLRVGNEEFDFFNPCNNPSDAWPIMLANGIATITENGEIVGATNNSQEYYENFGSRVYSEHDKEKPLRAAMIVYLMIKDEE